MSTPHPHTHVDVLLSAQDRKDADAVFGALERVFPETKADHGPTEAARTPAAASGSAHPTVWALDVDAQTHGSGAGPVGLRAPVTADLSGDPHHVHEVETALAQSFGVDERSSVSGDQELEVRLRLTARDAAAGGAAGRR
ncbi:hypothetical protein ACFXJ5_26765 [Streptomyces sp. NPDC059373]